MQNYMKKMLPAFIAGNRYKTPSAYCACGNFYSYATKVAKYDKATNTIALLKGKFSFITNCQRKAIREFAEANGINLIERETI